VSFEPVDVHVADLTGAPVADVLVKIYDPTGTVFFTLAVTDEDGDASFLLETLDYSMRLYKQHTGFKQPQLFSVLATPETNAFSIEAEVFIMPIAKDARMCCCSGFFRDLDGAPLRNLEIHIKADFEAAVLESSAVIPGQRHIRTDDEGYAQIDLIRGGCYQAFIPRMGMDHPRTIEVPDALSANLPDVLFPVVGRIMLDPPGPYEIPVGSDNEIEVIPTVYDSAGRELTGSALEDVQWSMGDIAIASVTPANTKLTLRGLAAGTTELRATRWNQSIVRIPSLAIEGQPVAVVVT